MKKMKKQRGFTLPEVLVTIALIAALAAVVVPTIAGQLSKGDPNRIGSDYSAIRGGVEQFLSDVRKYPRNLGQLTNIITTSGTNLAVSATGGAYTSSDVARWKGPYLSKDSTAAGLTGFGYTLSMDTGSVVSAGTIASPPTNSGTNYWCTQTPASCVGAQKYLILNLKPAAGVADTLDWAQLDKAVDDGQALLGNIRYASVATNGTAGMIRMLLLPIQP
jgi:prepilin-type N-terminal cleavage/methylation domain-containing protein